MRRPSTRAVLVVGAAVVLFLAGVLSYYASSHPDGLMYVAGRTGILGSEAPHPTGDSPFAGYAVRGIANARLSGGLAGLAGVAVVAAVAGALIWLLRRQQRQD